MVLGADDGTAAEAAAAASRTATATLTLPKPVPAPSTEQRTLLSMDDDEMTTDQIQCRWGGGAGAGGWGLTHDAATAWQAVCTDAALYKSGMMLVPRTSPANSVVGATVGPQSTAAGCCCVGTVRVRWVLQMGAALPVVCHCNQRQSPRASAQQWLPTSRAAAKGLMSHYLVLHAWGWDAAAAAALTHTPAASPPLGLLQGCAACGQAVAEGGQRRGGHGAF